MWWSRSALEGHKLKESTPRITRDNLRNRGGFICTFNIAASAGDCRNSGLGHESPKSARLSEGPVRVTGGKTLSEYMFSEPIQIADIVGNAGSPKTP